MWKKMISMTTKFKPDMQENEDRKKRAVKSVVESTSGLYRS